MKTPLINHETLVRHDGDRIKSDFARAQRSGSSRSVVRAAIAALAVFASVTGVDEAAAARGETLLVNQPQGALADDYSDEASVSADGRFVAFTSMAKNLSDADGDGIQDVFVRDMQEETVVLVSRSSGSDGAGGQYASVTPSISANGRFVAFTSEENNFTDEDKEGADVFVRDLNTDTTTLVSRASGASGAGGDSDSYHPSISANGRYVAFVSNADNLSTVSNAYANVFVRDLKTQRTTLVSRASGRRGAAGDSSSVNPSVSGGGRYVAFASAADNLSRQDNDTYDDVFVRDLKSNDLVLVSRRGRKGPGGGANSFDPSISANGRSVAFGSAADNLDPAGDDPYDDIYVRDLEAGTTRLVSRRSGANGAKAKSNSFQPSISADGSKVAFQSDANNLSRSDDDDWDNVFVRDLGSNRTLLVSRASGGAGEGADAHSHLPAISGDGRFVAFGSAAENLSADDAAGIPDVFRRDVRELKGTG